MAKQLNVNLAFTADTKAAQAQLKQLQQQLDAVMQPKNLDTSQGFTAEIQKGIAAASELKVKLMDATNVNTGKLDLTKFSQSLQKSNRQLEDYANDLAALGPQGSEAFLSLARAISNAETPFLRLSNRANEFLTTLKNTARWQISSSLLHGFMGTLQHAYGYAQDLNESLNNIRIVTGKSVDDMARFAKEANNAAKALSTTTTDYTDASLIYYQQGLSDQEVIGRTETTIKLANVSRQSAEEVSDQMTAIWNNFYDGSKSLEYYADVITALGAATASSSEEISTGLEKFAAVADTVGLSYEYATSALATITATTRQSADTVGTGLRTLLARLESVNLGETLDDGVTLSKYTAALDKIGVSVLDQNGELKDMDNILDSIAEKWQNLDRTTQTAVATTVGGVRQYATFLALMDNWDFMQSNLGVARGSEGTLQKQADIYAESWEAARKRVQASAEAIYDALLDDKFFIQLTDALSTILNGINGIIKSAGGLRGVLLGLSAILTRVFSNQMTSSISNMAFGLSQLTSNGRQQALSMKNQAWNLAASSVKDDGTKYGAARYQNIQDEARLQQQLIDGASLMSEEERKIYQNRLDIIRTYQDEYAEQGKVFDQLQELEGDQLNQIRGKILADPKAQLSDFQKYVDGIRNSVQAANILQPIQDAFKNVKNDSLVTIDSLKQKILELPQGAQAVNQLNTVFELLEESVGSNEFKIEDFNDLLQATLEDNEADIAKLAQKFEDPLRKEIEKVGETVRKTAQQQANFEKAEKDSLDITNKLGTALPNLSSKYDQLAQSITKVAQTMSQVAFAITSIQGLINNAKDAMKDGEVTVNEVLGIITSLAMTLSMVIPLLIKLIPILVSAAKGFYAIAGVVNGVLFGAQASIAGAIGLFGALAIAIGAVIAAGYGLYRWINRDKIAAKEAAKEYENLKTAAEETSETYNSLKENLNGYEDALTNLNSLEKGTQAWAKALEDVNNAYNKIKEENPEFLKGAKTHIENGVVVFDNPEEELEKYRQQARQADLNEDIGAINKAYADETVLNNDRSLENSLRASLGISDTGSLLKALQGAQTGTDVKSLAEKWGLEHGLDEYSQAMLSSYFESTAAQNEIIQHNNTLTANGNETNTKINELVANYLGAGYTDETYQLLYNAINAHLRHGYEITTDWLNQTVEGMTLMRATTDDTTDSVEKQVSALESLNKIQELLNNKDATAADWANANVDWSQFGVGQASEFIMLDEQEQQRRMLAVQMREKESEFTQAFKNSEVNGGANYQELQAERALYLIELQKQLADVYDLNAEELDDLTDYYSDFAIENDNVADSLQGNRSEALKVATVNARLNKGLKDLSDNWEDYNDILQSNDKESVEYQQTLSKLRTHLEDILNIDDDSLSSGFLESAENLDLMKRAAEGDVDAVEELRAAAATDIVQHANVYLNDENAREKLDELNNYLIDYANNNNLEIGANLDNTDFINSCNEIVAKAGMTATQAADYFKALGYDVKIENVDQEDISYDSQNGYWTDPETGQQRIIRGYVRKVHQESVPVVKAITYNGSAGGTVQFENTKGGKSRKPGGGSGGSQKQTKTDTDEIDRYHVIRETIRDLTAEYDKANKAKDRLFGADRVKKIGEEISATDKLIDAQKRYIDEIQDYLVKDENNLAKGIFSYTGIQADMKGGILQNYEQVMHAAIAKYNSDKSEKADENYEEFKELISQYEETFSLLDEANAELTDLINRNQDAYFERLNYVVELKQKVDEADLARINTTMTLLGDSVYKAAERLELLWNNTDQVKDKFDNLNDQFNTTSYQLEHLNVLFGKGLISEDQWAEGLDNARDSLQQQLETLIDYDDEMRTYYSTTLSSASAEMAFWTKQLEHSTSVLEHYKKVAELTGNAQNYNMLGILLKGQVTTRQNNYQASAQWLSTLQNQRRQIEAEMVNAQASGSYERVEWLRDKLESIIEETNQAEEQMLSDFESYMEAVSADLENDIAKINYNAEMLASNGLGFEYIVSDLDKLKTIQDEYLTKTNQVYETTKFLRQIQQDMDKTDNVASKEKLKNFQKMVEGLKEQGQLSQVELEIAKRRYEIELAQMALEDAKNAKSVIRLSRDSEGNYGYVYSADPNKANDAAQALEDKQNDLYNYALETYNNNITKLNELYKSQQDELSALAEDYYKNGLMTEEVYNQKVLEVQKRYHDEALIYLQNIDETRNVLNEVALTDYTEAYASHYNEIITTVDEWDQHTQENFDNVDARYQNWKDLVDQEVRPVIGNSLQELREKTDNVTIASNDLSRIISGQVLPKLDKELQSVNDVTAAYEAQRDSILALIDALREQINTIDALYSLQAQNSSAKLDQEIEFNKSTDYSAAMIEAAKRGLITNTSDAAYLKANALREAKIDWIKATGQKIDYKHRGEEATNKFQDELERGVYSNTTTRYNSVSDEELEKLLQGYATGGYTGSWGAEGRLALLHQKELVLNEDDTSNILSAVNLIREAAGMIDLQAMSAAAGIGALYSPTARVSDTTLDQNVHIEASFPSVTDHNEIEEALISLVNRAAQFANRQ